MSNNEVTIILNEVQAKEWVMMQFLSSIGVFDLKNGRVTIDFDGFGQIGNVKIEHNYKMPKLSTDL